MSPEVTVARIGPDLCVLPVTKELRSKRGMEAQKAQRGLVCVPHPSWCHAGQYRGNLPGITAAVEKLNTNTRNVNVLLVV